MEARVKTLGGGGNLLRTATMTGSLDPAWFTRWATGSWERSNLIIQDARVPRGMRAMVHYANGGQAVNSQVLTAQQVPAEPGKSYMGSVYCNSYLGRSNISVFFVDANGNLIGSEFASSASRKYGANGSLSDYERLFVLTGPAPANASTVWLQIATTKESAAGQDCAGWYVQPMLEQCPPDASLPSLWSAGEGRHWPSGEWLCARTGRSAVSSSPQRVRYLPSTCWLTCSVCHPQAPVCALSIATETGVFTTRTGVCVCDGALCRDQPRRAGNPALRNRQEAACRL